MALKLKLKDTDSVSLPAQPLAAENTNLPVPSQNLAVEKYNPAVENELPPAEKEYALACASLIQRISAYASRDEYKGNKCTAEEKYIELYNQQILDQDIFSIVGSKDIQSVRRWRKKYLDANKDYRALARNFERKKTSAIPLHQAKILMDLALDPRQRPISEIVRLARESFIAKNEELVFSKQTYARYLEKERKENRAIWGFYREGEAYLDKHELPFSIRDWERVEVGDILFSDGHTTNFTIVDPITKKPKRMNLLGFQDARSRYLCGWDLDYSENIQSIFLALRRAILRLGKIPKVIYIDNGKAFSAQFFHGADIRNYEGLFARLGIKVIFSNAYHPQSKTIEPHWHVMAELERLMPSYTGTSIEMKPAYTKRGEKLHSKIHEKFMSGLSVNIFQAHQAITWWNENWANRVQETGFLKGQRPVDVFNDGKGEGVDPKILTFLMMEEKIGKVYRNGIKIFGEWYYSEELFGKEWEDVMIRHDLLYKDSIFVYDKYGQLICEAFPMQKQHPAAKLLGTDEDVKNLKNFLTLKNKLKNSVTHDAKRILSEEIIPAVKQQIEERNIYQLNQEETEPEEKPKSKKRKSLIDRWGDASIDPKSKRAMEA